jgi:hypothetical protein
VEDLRGGFALPLAAARRAPLRRLTLSAVGSGGPVQRPPGRGLWAARRRPRSVRRHRLRRQAVRRGCDSGTSAARAARCRRSMVAGRGCSGLLCLRRLPLSTTPDSDLAGLGAVVFLHGCGDGGCEGRSGEILLLHGSDVGDARVAPFSPLVATSRFSLLTTPLLVALPG